MKDIQRYTTGGPVIECSIGNYVWYADHAAVITENVAAVNKGRDGE